MIRLKISDLAKRLEKPLTRIAEEAGINRNTLTALVQTDVTGMKFSTIEALCKTYGVTVSDLIEYVPNIQHTGGDGGPLASRKIYKQEGEIVPFTMYPPALAWNSPSVYGIPLSNGDVTIYCRGEYGYCYENAETMRRMAHEMHRVYEKPDAFEQIYAVYVRTAKIVESFFTQADIRHIDGLATEEFRAYHATVLAACMDFWKHSIFIDAFDVGVDQEAIDAIAQRYQFSIEEVGVLTTPTQMTFNNERRLAILEIAASLAKRARKAPDLIAFLREQIRVNPAIEHYKRQFAFVKANYAIVQPITDQELREELEAAFTKTDALDVELSQLRNYDERQKDRVARILKTHKLCENPLAFFAKLTYWREHRKKTNNQSVYVQFLILESLEHRVGIPMKFLTYITQEEVDHVLKRSINREMLERRHRLGIAVHFENGSYEIFEGNEAQSIHEELEKRLAGEDADALRLQGQTASQGYAKGVARIILNLAEFDKMQEGDILVTGMTRPEFLPIMKKAAAIVTNEGGITCHAAIVSRELGIPCIIGTKTATQKLKDGDIVEVRANHGTVRILKQNDHSGESAVL